MGKYRKTHHRKIHPKIFVWSHTKRTEIEYFLEFKHFLRTPLLMPMKEILWTPQELIGYVIKWKKKNISNKDKDQVWCIFDVDDFYEKDKSGMIGAIKKAHKNNIKIAYTNECFELWIILHFELLTSPIKRGKDMEIKIQKLFKKYKLGTFKKNQKVFSLLQSYQNLAISNSKKLSPASYDKIGWNKVLSGEGNPSSNIHMLIEEINKTLIS